MRRFQGMGMGVAAAYSAAGASVGCFVVLLASNIVRAAGFDMYGFYVASFWLVPLFAGSACWVALRKQGFNGYAGSAAIVVVGTSYFIGTPLPGLLVVAPFAAAVLAAVGRLGRGARTDPPRPEKRWTKWVLLSIAGGITLAFLVGGVFVMREVEDGWESDREYALARPRGEIEACYLDMSAECGQIAADRTGHSVAWLPSAPGMQFAKFIANEEDAIQIFVAPEGPAHTVEVVSFPPSEAGLGGATITRTIDGIEYGLDPWTEDAFLGFPLDFAVLSWERGGASYEMNLTSGLFGGPIEEERLFGLVPELQYSEPVAVAAPGDGKN